jgi:hypothetical protein
MTIAKWTSVQIKGILLSGSLVAEVGTVGPEVGQLVDVSITISRSIYTPGGYAIFAPNGSFLKSKR